MASFTYYGNFENVEVRYLLTQNKEANTSTISATAYHKRPSGSGGSYNYSSVNFSLTIAGNTKSRSWTWDRLPAGGEREILSHSVTISHNADGSHAPVQISVYCATGTSSLGTVSASQSVALATIPRAASLVLSQSRRVIGAQSVSITVDRKSASFRHRVYFEYNGQKHWINWLGQGTGTSTLSWTAPMSLCNWCTTAEQFAGVIGVLTYQSNGSTVVGDRWVPFTLVIPSNIAPTIREVYHYASARAVEGAYWQNHTRIGVGVKYGRWQPEELYGARLERVEITAAGRRTILTRASHPSVFAAGSVGCSDLFDTPDYGLRGFQVALIDSRGRRAEKTGTYPVEPYEAPKIRSFRVERCDQAGRPMASGGRALASYDVAIATVGEKNTATLTITSNSGIQYRQSLGGYAPYTRNTTQQVGAIDTNRAHEFTLTVQDKAGNRATYQAYVGKGEVLLDICPTGVSAGESAEANTISLKSGEYRVVVQKDRGIRAQKYANGRVEHESDLLAFAGFRVYKFSLSVYNGFATKSAYDLGVSRPMDYAWFVSSYYSGEPHFVTLQVMADKIHFYVRNNTTNNLLSGTYHVLLLRFKAD